MWGFAGGVEGCGPDGSFVCLKGRGAGGKRGGGGAGGIFHGDGLG